MNKIWNILAENCTLIIALSVSGAVLVWTYGCEPKVASLTNPTIKVTRYEMEAELDQLLAIADLRYAQLDQQDAFKEAIFNHSLKWAASGTIDPIGILTTLGTLVGAGAISDNVRIRRKRRKEFREYVDTQKARDGP